MWNPSEAFGRRSKFVIFWQVLFGLIILLATWPWVGGDFRVLAEEGTSSDGVQWGALEELCTEILFWDESTPTRTFRIEVYANTFEPSPGGFYGLLQTGLVNDGLRLEIDEHAVVGLVVQNRVNGPNEFLSFQVSPERSETKRQGKVFSISIVLSERGASVKSGYNELSLSNWNSRDCSDPKIGVNFDDSRIFPGELVATILEKDDRVLTIRNFRSSARKSLIPTLFIFLIARTLRERRGYECDEFGS